MLPPSTVGVTTEVVVNMEVMFASRPSLYLERTNIVEPQFPGNGRYSMSYRYKTINKNSYR